MSNNKRDIVLDDTAIIDPTEPTDSETMAEIPEA